MRGRLSLYLSMATVRSGSSCRTVSPRVNVARRPGIPFKVLTGIRVRMDSSTSNSAGSSTMGSCRGRKPRIVETMNAGSVVSSGLVSRRTSNDRDGPRDPITRREVGLLGELEGLKMVLLVLKGEQRILRKMCEFQGFYCARPESNPATKLVKTDLIISLIREILDWP
jgi:hypothetical protein